MRKPGTGRRRIEIKRIDNKDARMVTFSKRRTGVFRKAQSLADLFGLSIAVVVFSPGGRAFTCGDLSLIDRFLAQSQSQSGAGNGGASSSSAPAAVAALEAKRQKAAVAAPEAKRQKAEGEAEGEVESEEELREYLRCLEELKRRVVDRINLLSSRSESYCVGSEDSAADSNVMLARPHL